MSTTTTDQDEPVELPCIECGTVCLMYPDGSMVPVDCCNLRG